MTANEFKQLLVSYFPKLEHCGGYHLCRASQKGILEPLSKLVYSSPEILKQRCGANRTYIIPLQHSLDLSAEEQNVSETMEKCHTCGHDFPIDVIATHILKCDTSLLDLDSSDDDIFTISNNEMEDFHHEDSYNISDDEYIPGAIHPSVLSDESCETSVDKDSATNTILTVEDIILNLKSNLSHSEPLRITVRRQHIFVDAMEEAKKKRFDPTRLLKVCFVKESGVDLGGIRREFLTLLSNAASNILLRGFKKKFFTNNITEIQAQHFYYLGVYTAMSGSVVQGGCGLPVLAEPVYDYILSGKCTNIDVNISDIPDGGVSEIVHKVMQAGTDVELNDLFSYEIAANALYETGYNKLPTIADKHCIIASLLEYHCMIKVKAAMDQFIDELKTLNVHNAVSLNPQLMRNYFVYCSRKVRGDDIRSLVKVKFNDNATVAEKELEEQAYILFEQFLNDAEDGELPNGCSVQNLLVIFTGMDTIPAFGFEKSPSITFNRDPTAIFPTASTCEMELRIPIKHGNQYLPFRDSMVLALMGNDGFGQL